MSTEADIVERLQHPVMLHSSAEHTNAERREAAAEITKLRAERDAAVLAERERCKKSVRNTICNMSWPPEDGDQLIDDLQMGIALFATDREANS